MTTEILTPADTVAEMYAHYSETLGPRFIYDHHITKLFEIWDDKELTEAPKMVAHSLMKFMNFTTGWTSISRETVASDTCLSLTSVKKGIHELVGRGHVHTRRASLGNGVRSHYTFTPLRHVRLAYLSDAIKGLMFAARDQMFKDQSTLPFPQRVGSDGRAQLAIASAQWPSTVGQRDTVMANSDCPTQETALSGDGQARLANARVHRPSTVGHGQLQPTQERSKNITTTVGEEERVLAAPTLIAPAQPKLLHDVIVRYPPELIKAGKELPEMWASLVNAVEEAHLFKKWPIEKIEDELKLVHGWVRDKGKPTANALLSMAVKFVVKIKADEVRVGYSSKDYCSYDSGPMAGSGFEPAKKPYWEL